MFERRLGYPPNMLFFLPRPDVIVSIHAAISMQSHSQPRVGCDQKIRPFYLFLKSCRVCQMQRENILKILIKPSNNIFEKHLYPHKSVWHWYLKIRPYHLHSIFLGCMELSMVISTHSSIYPWICPSAFAARILKFFQNLHVRNFIDQSSSFLHHFKILHKVCKQHLQIINNFLVMSVKDFRHQT